MKGPAAAAAVLLWTSAAGAACPYDGLPRKACEPIDAYFMPGVVGLGYWPGGDGHGPWLGAGFQVAPVTWSRNTEKFGPGQGKVVFDVGLLGSGEADTGKMLLYRLGGQLSIERNASRIFAIPFYGIFFGGMNERALGHQSFVETTAGLHLLYLRNAVVSVEAGYLFPFEYVDELAGWRASLSVNVQAW